MPRPNAASKPVGQVVAAALSGAAAVFMAVLGVISAATNVSPLSAAVGGVLLLWAAIIGVASLGLYRGRRWSRGPVVAAALLHVASFANFVPSQTLAVIPAAVALATVVAAVWPTTTAALYRDAQP